MGAAAAAGGVSAGSQILAAKMQANAIEEQGEFQAQQLKFNSQIAMIQRKEIEDQADSDSFQKQKEVNQMLGAQKASMAANGLDVTGDLAQSIQSDTRKTGQEDVVAIKNNAWREAWGMKVKATDLSNQSNYAIAGSKFGAATTLITGGLQAAGTSADYGYKASKA